VLDPVEVLGVEWAVQLGQLLAEVVQGEAHDIEEVPVHIFHQHSAQGLDAIPAGLVPAWGWRDREGRREREKVTVEPRDRRHPPS
jgi:hypothetical protein